MQIFEQILDISVISLIVVETNRYAQQYISSMFIRRNSRMNKWHDVSNIEMKKFIGAIFMTKPLKFPGMEDYWKIEPLYFHSIFHHIRMTYNRFSLIPKRWYFSNSETAPEDDRLYTISTFMEMLLTNIQELYIPGEEISVDETMISHRGRLLFRQYNPGKSHKYGIKMFKL